MFISVLIKMHIHSIKIECACVYYVWYVNNRYASMFNNNVTCVYKGDRQTYPKMLTLTIWKGLVYQ